MNKQRQGAGNRLQGDSQGRGAIETDDVGTLFERHADSIMRYCHMELGSRADAEDAVSETFARVIRSPRREIAKAVEGDADRAWLFGIARNVIREQRRYRRRHPASPSETIPDQSDPTAQQPHDLAMLSVEIGGMKEAMDQLSEVQKQVLLLRFIAGLSSEETGKVLGKSPGATRVQQMRALEKLKTLLDKDGVRLGEE